jgi:Tfp pilus assembly protein PilN
MKNHVNLYQHQFHPKLQLLTLWITTFSWCIAGLLCMFVYIYLTFQQQGIELNLIQVKQKQKQQQDFVNELEKGVNNLKVDVKLLDEAEQKQRIIDLKKRVLDELTGREGLKSIGFSHLMLDLANNHQPGLWLTSISLNGRSVTIEGAADESSIVPRWLGSLGLTDYFKGQEFADTRLYRDADQLLNFVVATGSLTDKPQVTKND